jgi:hypothetical protein
VLGWEAKTPNLEQAVLHECLMFTDLEEMFFEVKVLKKRFKYSHCSPCVRRIIFSSERLNVIMGLGIKCNLRIKGNAK